MNRKNNYRIIQTSAKMTLILGVFVLAVFCEAFAASSTPMANYCNIGSNTTTNVPPNVLIILDNSNSMDEDFVGNGVGSYTANSKSVSGRSALNNLINTYANQMNIGLMTFRLPSASKYYLHNSGYFISYNPKSYCPNPPPNCVNYCINGDSADQTACQTACQAQNSLFDATYLLEAGTLPVGNALRTAYCPLIYPKTVSVPNPADPSNNIYYAQALPFYDTGNDGTAFLYSPGYSLSTQSAGAGQGPYNGYDIWFTKTGTSDGTDNAANGYSNYWFGTGLVPTDSDVALGYFNFGQRMFWYYVGPTWFANSSPGNGYLQIPIAANNSSNTQANALLAKLSHVDSSADYMSCTNTGNPNACSYVINAGLTPTAGTFHSTANYFSGSTDYQTSVQYASPIQYRCQKNFIVFVTDGLPSNDQNGNSGDTASLMPDVITQISNLRCPTMNMTDASCKFTASLSGTSYPFDIQTYVLGEGLTATDKATLDQMAVAGGTVSANTANPGHAFYADNPAQLIQSLDTIFQNIGKLASSGTAASVLASSQGSGAIILQAVFYQNRQFDNNTSASWTGALHNLWYYLDPALQKSDIFEDTGGNKILNLQNDYRLVFYYDTTQNKILVQRYSDDGYGNYTFVDIVPLESLTNLWEAGTLLWSRNIGTSPRTIYTTTDGSTMLSGNFTASNAATLQSYLQTSSTTQATNLINYISGYDNVCSGTTTPCNQNSDCSGGVSCLSMGYRNRTVTIGTNSGVWKLGDIVSSTPQIESSSPLNTYDQQSPQGYGDATYSTFSGASTYTTRGMVYSGANDGMLHAFKLGTIDQTASGFQKAALCADPGGDGKCGDSDESVAANATLGTEQWAFIPKNVLPYLNYFADPNYCHLYYVDGSPDIFDASINVPSGCSSNYYDCTRVSSSWRTILIGSMGLGGACRDSSASCNTVSGVSGDQCVKTPVTGNGFSSYYALDVTNQQSPSLLWEFSNPGLGYSLAGPAIIRIDARPGNGTNPSPDNTKNGHWFAVFVSGPTGPIDTTTRQFMGNSDQDLQIFILDLVSGQLLRTIDTGIPNAFATSLHNSPIDVDRWNPTATGFYQDDVFYIGYVKLSGSTWTNGGVIRVTTQEDPDPNNWTVSTVIDGIGPVTTSVVKLQDRQNGKLWLYFGTGRFFYKTASTFDDPSSTRTLYGVKEPCYQSNNTFSKTCNSFLSISGLSDKTTSPSNAEPDSGWYINLAAPTSTYGAERVITDPLSAPNGIVYFTTYQPATDPCSLGGNTYIWQLGYNTGSSSICFSNCTSNLFGSSSVTKQISNVGQGKALIQVSTGSIQEVMLSSAFTQSSNRQSLPISGIPPKGQGLSIVVNPGPLKKILHLKEK